MQFAFSAVFDAFFAVFDALSLFSSFFFGQFRRLPPLLSSCFDVLPHRHADLVGDFTLDIRVMITLTQCLIKIMF